MREHLSEFDAVKLVLQQMYQRDGDARPNPDPMLSGFHWCVLFRMCVCLCVCLCTSSQHHLSMFLFIVMYDAGEKYKLDRIRIHISSWHH